VNLHFRHQAARGDGVMEPSSRGDPWGAEVLADDGLDPRMHGTYLGDAAAIVLWSGAS
jgi:hypothetical protein